MPLGAIAICIGLLGMSAARAQATWDIASLEQNVQPMQHQLNGFTPILPWGLPVPLGTDAVTAQANGTLLQDAQALNARGIALVIDAGWPGDTGVGDVATAQTLQGAGLPIYVYSYMYGDYSSAPPGLDGNATAFWHVNAAPNPWASDGNQYWPAFPLATPAVGYNFIKNVLQNLANSGITSIQGLFTDYETYPVHWADMKASIAERTYFSQYYTDAYAAGNGVLPSQYGADLLTNDTMDQNNPMWKYSYDLRYALLKQSARQALTDVYGPAPIYGNYGAYFSSAGAPFNDGIDGPHPPSPPPESGIAAMPVAYANMIEWYFENKNPNNVQPTQQTADDVYWNTMLTEVSTSQANDGTVGRSIVFVSNYVGGATNPPWSNYYWMTPSVYKELLRHIWLRGAGGMYVFDSDPSYEPTQTAFDNLEYARSVLDEMLSFRTFLINGAPMNFSVASPMFGGGVEWSGMSNSQVNPTQWVVRTVSRTGSDSVVPAISPQAGLTFTNVPAPADGATFILNGDGSIHRVDSRPATAYLQLENNYQDSSGNGLNGLPGEYPGTDTPPTMTSDVPSDSSGTTSLLNGSYGLYASQTNGYSVSLSRDPSSYWNGSYIDIPDTGAAFNAPSFTVEAFVKVASGISQDSASIISKGVNSGPGNTDWTIQYRDFAGAGMVELGFYENSTTYAWIRTAGTPLTPDVWHHLAMTYDGNSRQVTLYVDGVAQPFGNHDDQISASGVLSWDFVRHTGDNVVLGEYDRGIDASFDDFRFTPEVLDPLQMLTVGQLD